MFDLARDCRQAGRKDLERELNAALNRSVKPIAKAVHAEAERVMPSSGGYQAVLSKSLRVRARKAARAGRLTLVVEAKGKAEDRDVKRLDKGELRHPNPPGRSRRVKGRRVPNDWSTTRIRSGFASRPFEQSADEVRDELADAVGRVAEKLARG